MYTIFYLEQELSLKINLMDYAQCVAFVCALQRRLSTSRVICETLSEA